MKFNEELIEKLRNGKIVLENPEHSTLSSYKVKHIIKKAFPNRMSGAFGDSRYYCRSDINRETWTTLGELEIMGRPVFTTDSFFIDEKEERVKSAETHITRFPSGAVRSFSEGRLRPDYISPLALYEIAKHFTNASNDFGATNYFLGISPEEVNPSIARHYLDLQKALFSEDREKVRDELAALASNCIMALHQMALEDRGEYVKKYDKTESVEKESYLKELNNAK